MTMTGITSAKYLPSNPLFSTFNFSINSYIVEGNSISLITLQTNSWVLAPFITFVGVLLFSLLMFLNYKIYCKKVRKSKRILKKQKNKSLLMQLILLTIFKCIILGLVFFSIKQKYNLAQKPIKVVGKNYFLSIEFFGDTYNSMELQTKSLHQWYAMSKIKFNI